MRRFTAICLTLLLASCRHSEVIPDNNIGAENSNPTISREISNKKVYAIAEDAQGHIWIGTFRGLNKYNRHEYHQYFGTNDPLSIPDNQICDLYLDSRDRLWVATVNGVALYTDRDEFRSIPLNAYNRNVQQIVESGRGRMFFNAVNGIYSYNDETDEIEMIMGEAGGTTLYSQCHIDSNDRLWINTSTSLNCYDPNDMSLQDSVALQGYPTYSYLYDGHELWLAGNGNVAIFDTHTHRFREVSPSVRKLLGGRPI